MATKLLIDSASDINLDEANALGITLMPMVIQFGEEEYLDGVNLLPQNFYEKLVSIKDLPKTSQINSYRFEEVFEQLTANGDAVVAITISSKLSGTYNSALQASKKFEGKVFVVDSLNACIGERLLGLRAVELINEGKSAKDVAEELDKIKSKINVLAVIDTLEYLKKGGRISATVAFAGSLLSIKPLIGVVDGEVKLIGKAMGMKRGLLTLNSMVKEKGGINLNLPYGLVWSGEKSNLDKFKFENSELWSEKSDRIEEYQIGSTIGTHVGPGAIGIAFFEK